MWTVHGTYITINLHRHSLPSLSSFLISSLPPMAHKFTHTHTHTHKQVIHFKYRNSIADVWLLSLFRAGPGTWVLWRLREERREGRKAHTHTQTHTHTQPSKSEKREERQTDTERHTHTPSPLPIKRTLTRQTAFMLFKTLLSF